MKGEISLKHSHKCKNVGTLVVICTALLLFLVPALSANAQMFSADSQQESPQFNDPQSNIYLGLEPITVTYKGGANAANATALFEFEGPLIRLGYENNNLDLSMGVGGELTGIDGVSYFDIGGSYSHDLSLTRSQYFSVYLPVKVGSRFVNMTNSEIVATNFNRFRFGSLMAGAGARALVRPSENIRIDGSIVPKYGFAFSSGGLFGGGLGSVSAQANLYFDRLFGRYGASIGYAYDLRSYDIEENVYDYDLKGHIFQLGITF